MAATVKIRTEKEAAEKFRNRYPRFFSKRNRIDFWDKQIAWENFIAELVSTGQALPDKAYRWKSPMKYDRGGKRCSVKI